MRRFHGEYEDDMREARRRAAETQRSYDEEQDREYARWRRENMPPEPSLFERQGHWEFKPIFDSEGQISGFKAMLNGQLVALIIPRKNDLVIMMTDPEGGVRAQYRRGATTIDQRDVLDAFMAKQLEGGAR